jgi:hypothetical protein
VGSEMCIRDRPVSLTSRRSRPFSVTKLVAQCDIKSRRYMTAFIVLSAPSTIEPTVCFGGVLIINYRTEDQIVEFFMSRLDVMLMALQYYSAPSNIRFLFISTLMYEDFPSEGHQTLLIIDRRTRAYYLWDPWGTPWRSPSAVDMAGFLSFVFDTDIPVCKLFDRTYPSHGPQTLAATSGVETGHCVTWTSAFTALFVFTESMTIRRSKQIFWSPEQKDMDERSGKMHNLRLLKTVAELVNSPEALDFENTCKDLAERTLRRSARTQKDQITALIFQYRPEEEPKIWLPEYMVDHLRKIKRSKVRASLGPWFDLFQPWNEINK